MSLINQVLHDLKARGVRTERFYEPGAIARRVEMPHVVSVVFYAMITFIVMLIVKSIFHHENFVNLKLLERHQIPTEASIKSNWLDADTESASSVASSHKFMRPESKLLAQTGGQIQEFLKVNPDSPLTEEIEIDAPSVSWHPQLAQAASQATTSQQEPEVLSQAKKEISAPINEKMLAEMDVADDKLAVAEKFYQDNPDNLLVREKLTQLYIDNKNYAQAKPLIEANLKLSPDNQRFISQRVALALKTEGIEAAVDCLEKMDLAVKTHPDIHALKATLYQQTGRHALAIDTLWDLIAQYPDDPRYWIGVGESLAAHGRVGQAKDSFYKAAQLAKSDELKAKVLEQVNNLENSTS